MFATSLALGWRLAIFFVAGVAAGITNGIAGGGTFLTFPTLLAMGVPALQANVSATVGVVPASLGGIRGSRHQLATLRPVVRSLLVPCLAGTSIGCALLLVASPHTFRSVVPWLIGAATILFALSPWLTARLAHVEHSHPARRWGLVLGVFLTSIYGGYFGAGIGILLLSVMAITLPYGIYELQGLRNALTMVINVMASVIFIARGHLALDAVYMMMAGTLLGGWLGTLLMRRLPANAVRLLIVSIGVATTVRLFLSK